MLFIGRFPFCVRSDFSHWKKTVTRLFLLLFFSIFFSTFQTIVYRLVTCVVLSVYPSCRCGGKWRTSHEEEQQGGVESCGIITSVNIRFNGIDLAATPLTVRAWRSYRGWCLGWRSVPVPFLLPAPSFAIHLPVVAYRLENVPNVPESYFFFENSWLLLRWSPIFSFG